MSNFEMFGLKFGQDRSGMEDGKAMEHFMASGLGSRGGPNKVSNKLRSRPMSYLSTDSAPLEYFMATGLRSRGGPNKASNKLRSRPISYLFH